METGEKPKVSENLLLLSLYPLSDGVIKQVLSEKDINTPLQVTEEQKDIISEKNTLFLLGRSGTGKTTVLTMKLLQNELSFRAACDGIHDAESSTIRDPEVEDPDVVEDGLEPDDTKPSILRQLFVTLSPRICQGVNQQVLKMKSDPNLSAVVEADRADLSSISSELPNTFADIPKERYPLVITFQKFLLMLDGTFGESFFIQFREDTEDFDADVIRERREVSYEKFRDDYWINLNKDLRRKFDPSRVFTEIISHIKGGVQARASHGGILLREDYILLAKNRSSSLTEEERRDIYSLFESYEKTKATRKEFDMGDFVNYIHSRLQNGGYHADKMDFIFIDEVQDLCLKHIELFKYLSDHHDKGFIFAGDTAQTIAKGVDFRFQDIKSLFYTEFLKNEDKGSVMQLTQNFRTHSGVLNLANSITQMLSHYFPNSFDKLKPETSIIVGEVPVLVECGGGGDNVIKTIVGEKEGGGGFGAQQVILVRDENSKKDICKLVEKNALVLTIMECKGLEFEDVLLYNFFGTSPFKKWRVIKGYMKDANVIEESVKSRKFDESQHSILCSELKQLYVAITRTRHRLWICENKEDLCQPMYDYWKRMHLVTTVKLNESVTQAMRATSSIKEWNIQGRKLFDDENFDMAALCFEKAGEKIWESRAKASGLKKLTYEMKGVADEQKDGVIVDSCVDLNWKFLKDIASCTKGNKKLKPNQYRHAEKIREQVEPLMYSIVALLHAVHVNEYPEYLKDINVHVLGMQNILHEVWVLGTLFSTSLSDQGPDYDTILKENGLENVLPSIRNKRSEVEKHWKEIKKLLPEQALKKYIEHVQTHLGKANTWNHKVRFEDGVVSVHL